MPGPIVTNANRADGGPTKLRSRPPMLTLGNVTGHGLSTQTIVETAVSPTAILEEYHDADDGSSSPTTVSSGSSSPTGFALSVDTDSDATSDDLSKDLAMLETLRRNVNNNLRLRPLRLSTLPNKSDTANSSSWHVPSVDMRTASGQSSSPTSSAGDCSAAPSPALSIYYTPTSEFLATPLSARYVGHCMPHGATADGASSRPDRSQSHPVSRGVEADTLFKRLAASRRPLLIDTRQTASYLAFRIQHSLNIAIPSLIMRRCRKPGGGLPSLDTLRTYITTERGKDTWDDLMRPGGAWDGDVVVYDDEMDENDRDNPQALAWAMLSLVQPLLENGVAEYLKGGISGAGQHPLCHKYITMGEDSQDVDIRLDTRETAHTPSPRKAGLFQLDTRTASRARQLPEIEAPSASPSTSAQQQRPPLSPYNSNMLVDLSPSPSPSSSMFPQIAQTRKSSITSLRRLDTSSAERLVPKLTVRTIPLKSNTLAAPLSRHSSSSSLRLNSPSHLNLVHSNVSGLSLHPTSRNSSNERLSPQHANARYSNPHTPVTPTGFPLSPVTARPEMDQPPTTEDPLPVFSVSSILPNFLFLGPELTSNEHVEELLSLGVRRILNIAFECDDDQGLRLRERFEKYTRIPMRDNVEEENVARSVREACEALDDARLHSAPTYVHCKAGKSRSVTAVIAYLIHANHWTLSRAYAFVTERRKGISPNIGFVSELMTFEEQELGGKSVGVVGPSVNVATGVSESDEREPSGGMLSYAPGGRRAAHMRESLPPILQTQLSEIAPGQMSAGGLGSTSIARVGDSAQEVEVKDASGRYRHMRRAPVDENTLQPMRRVSKAGLESSSYSSVEV